MSVTEQGYAAQPDNNHLRLLRPDDAEYIHIMAEWYFNEWNVPPDKTYSRLNKSFSDNQLFQMILLKDARLIAAGGVSDEVNLLRYCPEYKSIKHWLAMVYTIPEERGKGYGAELCRHIQNHAKSLGLSALFLYTDTAERLYRRLGWEMLEYANMNGRKVAVMKLRLTE